MPRPKVKDEDRKRVSRACDNCKRRKEKCDGQQPCLLCRRRNREPECTFADSPTPTSVRRESTETNAKPESQGRANLKGNGKHGGTNSSHYGSPGDGARHPKRSTGSLREGSALSPSQTTKGMGGLSEGAEGIDATSRFGAKSGQDSTDAEIAIESLLTLSGGRSAPKTPQTGSVVGEADQKDDLASRAPVPKLARLLRDGHGKFIFVGDSSNLAFLQNIRRLVKTAIGDCQLNTDPMRHAMIEAVPAEKILSPRTGDLGLKPEVSEARDLVYHYLLATSGVIDLFEPDEIIRHTCAWAEDQTVDTDFNTAICYIVLAIGGQARARGGEELAERQFARGWELSISGFANDPSILTVQSHAMIAYYMLSTCRRNAAFMLLGIAVRAAHALGLHRSDISALFETRERKTRERVWKSLRMLDLFMSASLGRPPATSEVDGGFVSWDKSTRDYEDISMGGLGSSAMLRICFIFERIMNEVYCRREVSVQLVESISRQYRDWTQQLPTGLEADGLAQKGSSGNPSLQQTIGVSHVKGAYYWSIILLTRPFLIFKVTSRIKGRDDDPDQGITVAQTLSEACIDAALRSIEIANDLMHLPDMPRRLFAVVNSTFVSALVVGFAIFGNFDKTFPLLSSLDQAQTVLEILGKEDPTCRRYGQILVYLREASTEHIRRRDLKENKRRRQDIHSIFGNLVNNGIGNANHNTTAEHKVESDPIPQANGMFETQAASYMPSTGYGFSTDIQDFPWQQNFEMMPLGMGPVLTTSGIPASGNRETGDYAYTESMDPRGELSPAGSGIPSLPSYAEEFPLFSLTADFETFGDPFSMSMT